MRRPGRHLLATLTLTTALGAGAGCGGSDDPEGEGLPRATVSQLERRLDEVGRRYTTARDRNLPGACDDIEEDSFPAIEELLASLPDDVDPDLREAVDDSFARLRELTSEGCAGVEPEETETEAPPPDTEIETIPPEPAPPQTTPPETTPPETDAAPGGEGEGDGNGNGNGRGNGGTPPGLDGGGAPAPQGGRD